MTDSLDLDQSSTHSLHYGSDFKDVHCLQLQNIGKLKRGELEDLYYQLHDENIQIKKKFNNLDNKYKIMATRVMRLSRDHKCVTAVDREEEQRQLQQLKQNEAALKAKLTVMRGQLASHTRLHSAALSKTPRTRSHRCSRICHSVNTTCGGGDDTLLDTSRAGSHSRSQSRHRSLSCSGSQVGGGLTSSKDHNELVKANAGLRNEVATLQEGISVLQKDMQLASEQNRIRIQELEAELGKHLAHETAENVELIRTRRTIKQQEATITSLQQDLQTIQHELQTCKAALALAARDQDEICSTLMRERQRSSDLQHEVVKLSQACSSMREIQEELNDVKKENVVLKEHSNLLLQLTTGSLKSPRSDLDQSPLAKRSPVISQDSESVLREFSATDQNLDSCKKQQPELLKELKEAQTEITSLQKQIKDAIEERNSLKDEFIRIQSECAKLRRDLAEPSEERKRMVEELSDIRSACARLSEEITRSKSELQQHQSQHHALIQEVQERRLASDLKEPDNQLASSASPMAPPNRPLFHTPQQSARPGHYLSTPHSYSHPSTPRPRVGDACLALLEQTAIRPTSNSFPGILGSHGSLQERFLELCIPASSVSSSSTPLPPASFDEPQISKAVRGKDVPQISEVSPSLSPNSKPGYQVQHSTTGQSDAKWELDKTREMLRVQFNLNSIYKKEISSLSNIVQSLTTGTNGESR